MGEPPEHQDLTDALLAGLATRASELRGEVFEATTNALTAIAKEQQSDRDSFNARNNRVVNALVLVAAVACLAIIAGAWGFWTVRTATAKVHDLAKANQRSAVQLEELARANRANTNIIRDCTEPSGKCSQRGQRQQSTVVMQLLTGFCAGLNPDSPTLARHCVAEATAALTRTPKK